MHIVTENEPNREHELLREFVLGMLDDLLHNIRPSRRTSLVLGIVLGCMLTLFVQPAFAGEPLPQEERDAINAELNQILTEIDRYKAALQSPPDALLVKSVALVRAYNASIGYSPQEVRADIEATNAEFARIIELAEILSARYKTLINECGTAAHYEDPSTRCKVRRMAIYYAYSGHYSLLPYSVKKRNRASSMATVYRAEVALSMGTFRKTLDASVHGDIDDFSAKLRVDMTEDTLAWSDATTAQRELKILHGRVFNPPS